MSDPNDVTRPRSPLALYPKTPRPATALSPETSRPPTPRDEMARRLYPKSPRPATPLDDASVAAGVRAAERATAHMTPAELALKTARSVLCLDSAIPDLPSPTADLPGGQPWRRYKLGRDRERPIEFDGRVRAEVQELSFGGQVALRAAIYETRGGKFIAEMTRCETREGVDYGTLKRPFLFAKATVFDSLDICAMSFRTQGGRLTERLLRQIGDVNSEFID